MDPLSLKGAIVRGCKAYPVDIEVSFSHGIPGISIIGLPNTSVLEVRSRLRSALRTCDFKVPRQHITISLLPAQIKKTGTSLDLAICIAILLASGQIYIKDFDKYLFCGEVGLDGKVKADSFASLYVNLAKELNLTPVICARSPLSITERVKCIDSIMNLKSFDSCIKAFPEFESTFDRDFSRKSCPFDYANIYGQEAAKRAFMISAIGRHSIVMKGPAGVGKTMLARSYQSIAPTLTDSQADEVCAIYGAKGIERIADYYALPFRSPHHSITPANLIGGRKAHPIGEITLAHNGILFLDEMGEFNLKTLNELRVPFEEKYFVPAGSDVGDSVPCDFQLIAATNTCPCANLGNPHRECTCSKTQIENYSKRLHSPLFQRIDMHISLESVELDALIHTQSGLTSEQMRSIVDDARAFREDRKRKGITCTSDSYRSSFTSKGFARLESTAQRLHVSGRTFVKVVMMARSIADLEQSPKVDIPHVLEAFGYCERVKNG